MVEANLTEPDVLDYSIGALGGDFVAEVLPGLGRLVGRPSSGSPRCRARSPPASPGRCATARSPSRSGSAASAWTARNDAEQALRDSEARFRAVFTGAAIGIGIADTDGQILDVNRALRRHARLPRRGAARDQRRDARPPRRRRRACGSSTTSCSRAGATPYGWRSATTARTARRSGPTCRVAGPRRRRRRRGSRWRWSRTSPSGTSCRSGCGTRRCTTR